MSLDALRRLAIERAVPWDAMADDLSDLYQWQVSSMDANSRFHVAGREVHTEARPALDAAIALCGEVLASGYKLNSRCEIGAAGVTDSEGNLVGWRAHVDLGLREDEGEHSGT